MRRLALTLISMLLCCVGSQPTSVPPWNPTVDPGSGEFADIHMLEHDSSFAWIAVDVSLKESGADWEALAKRVLEQEDRLKRMASSEFERYNEGKGDLFVGFQSLTIEKEEGPVVVVECLAALSKGAAEYSIGFRFDGEVCVGVDVVH